jgi:hypothetical protein
MGKKASNPPPPSSPGRRGINESMNPVAPGQVRPAPSTPPPPPPRRA